MAEGWALFNPIEVIKVRIRLASNFLIFNDLFSPLWPWSWNLKCSLQLITLIHLDKEVFDKIHIWNDCKEVLEDSYLKNFGFLWFWNLDFHQLFACDNFKCVFYKIFLYVSRSNWTKFFFISLNGLLDFDYFKNFLIEVDWGQKLILKYQVIISFLVTLISNLHFIGKLSFLSKPKFLKYQFFINFLIITISKVDFTKKTSPIEVDWGKPKFWNNLFQSFIKKFSY